MSYDDDFEWQRKFLPEIQGMLGRALISEAPTEEDRLRNTDMMVLRLEAVRIACRVRRAIGCNGVDYLKRYSDEFTIRCSRPSNAQTELAKIAEGWGDYIFYGFASYDETSIAAAVLGDLAVFRRWRQTQIKDAGQEPGTLKPNGDGTHFRAYRIADLRGTGFVVNRRSALQLVQAAGR